MSPEGDTVVAGAWSRVWHAAWFSGVVVSGAVMWASSLAVTVLATERSADFDTTITAVRDGGRTVCVDRAQEPCGLRLDHPDRAVRLRVGQPVTVTEIWLDSGQQSVLAFHVRAH